MAKKLLLGNEAVARGLYEAGVTVVSSYPGTPSTEITEYVTKYNEMNHCGYTYTKSGITFTFKNMNEAVHFVRVMLGSGSKPKAIAGIINDASAKNKNYYSGKWGRIANE